jgi:serine/threonine-protein kinase RsbW
VLLGRDRVVTKAFVREMSCGGAMSDVPDLLEFVEAACADAEISPELCFDLTLAVEEAASNVIAHGYKGRGGPLSVRIEVAGGEVTIDLRDQAKPFKPGKIEAPDMKTPLEDRPLGGLGLFLMHRLMDEVQYEILPDGNLLTMVKRDVK